ncbi:hypothetical protein BGZ83_004857 [Gryganskiella cystojenkinii]|nr:hypothetical protein BGZ83_004857 [Gryganskiella cystojenkinii]
MQVLDGDMDLLNEDQAGGSHLPDITLDGKTFAPSLFVDLTMINTALKDQLNGLGEFLAERNHFIFQHTEETFRRQVIHFLRILRVYLRETLPELLRIIDDISALMAAYDQDLDFFLEDFESTQDDLEQCLTNVKAMTVEHQNTIQTLSSLSQELTDLMNTYREKAIIFSSNATKAKMMSAGFAVTCVITAPFAVALSPLTFTGSLLLISGAGGTGSSLIAVSEHGKSRIFTHAANKIEKLENFSKGFQSPISNIYGELMRTDRFLNNLRKKSARVNATGKELEFRKKAYEYARREARKIDGACQEIHRHALTIADLVGRLDARSRQIEQV